MAAFFDEPWTRLSPNLSAPTQSWLLNEAASRLQALGRLIEAVEPMRVSGEMDVTEERWVGAAISYSNLSELELTLGRLGEAVADGYRAIEFADRSKAAFRRLSSRSTTADALHQTGKWAEARALFAEAERMQAQEESHPQLYSVRGFKYVDLILALAVRAAWRRMLEPGVGRPELESVQGPLAACAEAERRAVATIGRRTGLPTYNLLDIALDHLTQARAALYGALLTTDDPTRPILPSAFADALARLRAANSLNHLPQALLTVAFYQGTLGSDPGEAARLLDEAQEIAERGPMPLYLADVHLHRARLAWAQRSEVRGDGSAALGGSFAEVDPRAELAKARKLIEDHGYWRRREELADAEAVICR